MRSPADMTVIQIDITNVCVHSCSNCTRFCGHHQQPFFMDYQTFQKAVDSLKDFPRMVGIIGGEPTLHPDFERYLEYLRKSRLAEKIATFRYPVEDMLHYIKTRLDQSHDAKTGLWSCLNAGYYKHFEVINETFHRQFLNDHDNTCLHQALLMPRKDLGIPDDIWVKKRDACFAQSSWSATITPKGAFFCEIAGALDMLFHGPGGWEIEPGWWKRTPDEFGEQLQWCELCSACLDVPQRISSDERDDITPQMYERLKKIHSPKIAKGMYVIHEPANYREEDYQGFTRGSQYIEAANHKRTSKDNRNIYPKEFFHTNFQEWKKVFLQGVAKDWVIISNNDEEANEAEGYFKNVIINPGCCYAYGNVILVNVRASSLEMLAKGIIQDNWEAWQYFPPEKIVYVDAYQVRHGLNFYECIDGIPDGSRLLIYGAGKNGKEMYARLLAYDNWEVCGWVDQNNQKLGYPIQGVDRLERRDFDYVLIAIQDRETFGILKDKMIQRGIAADRIMQVFRK